MTTQRIISAARPVAPGGTDAAGPATRLISRAEPLASVLARLELADEPGVPAIVATTLADEPHLPSISATALADVARVNDAVQAIPAKTPRFPDTADRRELHTTVEVRDRQGHRLGDMQFVRGA